LENPLYPLLFEFDGEEERNELLKSLVRLKKSLFGEDFKLEVGDASHSIEVDPNNAILNVFSVKLKSSLIRPGYPK
jgi:hypothetical protein